MFSPYAKQHACPIILWHPQATPRSVKSSLNTLPHVSLSLSPSLMIICKITLSGSAERPALSSMKAKFSTLDLPASTYLAALISGFDPSDPSWVNSPFGPMSNRWSQQANDNAFEYFSSFCGLTTLERNVTASSQAVLPSYVSHEAEHLIDEWELKSCGS